MHVDLEAKFLALALAPALLTTSATDVRQIYCDRQPITHIMQCKQNNNFRHCGDGKNFIAKKSKYSAPNSLLEHKTMNERGCCRYITSLCCRCRLGEGSV